MILRRLGVVIALGIVGVVTFPVQVLATGSETTVEVTTNVEKSCEFVSSDNGTLKLNDINPAQLVTNNPAEVEVLCNTGAQLSITNVRQEDAPSEFTPINLQAFINNQLHWPMDSNSSAITRIAGGTTENFEISLEVSHDGEIMPAGTYKYIITVTAIPD
ncbi:MAG: hypothetical protein EA414_20490 [Arthrospira sp. PLM2.Bin9]|nr:MULTISPECIES: hypothetical protein [unclassified Arthrospira]MBS0017305.1 hypothetical protein [Arthrospira sp. SH-MAG29]TVU51870.1 MAG: hypothetical protein EA414_20490 [Arthrospira sp. PLM2.Bin9]